MCYQNTLFNVLNINKFKQTVTMYGFGVVHHVRVQVVSQHFVTFSFCLGLVS